MYIFCFSSLGVVQQPMKLCKNTNRSILKIKQRISRLFTSNSASDSYYDIIYNENLVKKNPNDAQKEEWERKIKYQQDTFLRSKNNAKKCINCNSIYHNFSDKKELLDGMKKYCDGVDGVMKEFNELQKQDEKNKDILESVMSDVKEGMDMMNELLNDQMN